MKHLPIPAAALVIFGLASSLGSVTPAHAHPGALDGNGCHYETASGGYHCHREPRRNRDIKAPAKKSRENLCHDRSSPNYSTLKYFVSYPSMQACLASGGRAAGS